MKKILIAAGGTGGHVFPGIAIAKALERSGAGVNIIFAGTSRGLESQLLPKLGWPLFLFGSHSIKDKKGVARILAYLWLPLSVLNAFVILLFDRPALVISIGGYAAGPLVLAAWVLRIPSVLVEPNAIPGMTNRKLGRFAKKVFVAFEEAEGYFAGDKAVLTGVPIRAEVLGARREGAHEGGGHTLFVFGGSQGAVKLNEVMSSAAKSLTGIAGGVRVIHQTGGNTDPSEVEGAYRSSGIDADVSAFCDRIWECYEKADLVIARSGGNTVAELAALGLPSILVPYPHAADDHQRANAMALVRAGGARMIEDSECDGDRMAREIAGVLGDPARLEDMAASARSVGRPDAAEKIARECIGIIK